MGLYLDLTDAEFKVYHYILEYNKDKNFYYIPAIQHIMVKTGKGKTTVFRIMASLKKKGYIKNILNCDR